MVELYIAGQQVELDETVSFTINRYFEDTTDPTNIYSEWSKTITIPRTLHNNKIFGSIWNPDRLISSGTTDFGLDFDPYKRIDMRLERNGTLLLSGYLKVLSITQKGYQCTLNGELGKVIQELKKLTFDNTMYTGTDIKYLINGEDYYNETMSNELVYNIWNTPKASNELRKTTDAGYKPTDIIGYTPLNILTDSKVLDMTTFQAADGTAVKFSDVLDRTTNPSFVEATHCDGSTAIGDGLKPRDIGEWRSYLQQPFIYFNQLFQIVGSKCKELTGYTFSLDKSWFNDSNPYWNNMTMTLNNFDDADNSFTGNYYRTHFVYSTSIKWQPEDLKNTQRSIGFKYADKKEGIEILGSDDMTFNSSNFGNVGYSFSGDFTLWATNSYKDESLKDNVAMIIGIYKYVNGQADQIHQIILVSAKSTVKAELQSLYPRATFVVNDFKLMSNNAYCDIPVYGNFYSQSSDVNVTFGVSAVFYGKDWDGVYPFKKGEASVSVVSLYEKANTGIELAANVYDKYTRSGAKVTLNNLWDNSYNIFDCILNYCKMFRIGIFVDQQTKQLKFSPYKQYFSRYKISDWTDKVDYNSDFEVVPITFENKWVLFNYDDFSSAGNLAYKKLYGLQFGEKKVDTRYVFNTETKNLFSGIKPPVEASDNILSWTDLYENKKIVYTLAAESFISPKDDNDKLIDNFGTFYLDCGITAFDTESNLRSNVITDDSQVQRSTGKYYYNQYLNKKETANYHKLSPVFAQRIMTFAVPAESFTYQSYTGKTDIFNEIWKDYLNERYNVQNKKVTCYIKLSQSDFTQFDFNNFVLIGNQLYMVNKIFDYNPDELLTKVELITIQNIKAYLK